MEHAEMRLKEKVFGLFGPDALLPVQYFDLLRRKTPIEPEIRLMWAVLEDAVECYRRHVGDAKGKPNGEFEEVDSWIFDPDGDWLFSFENICATLGIDAEYLRSGLLGLKNKSRAAHPAGPMAHANSGSAEKGSFEPGVLTPSASLSFDSEAQGSSLRVEDRVDPERVEGSSF
ncbi:MAG TPA: hypothetical protein VGL70_13550 [Candidatus Binatia bacterium]|jgi:hypothetical protein